MAEPAMGPGGAGESAPGAGSTTSSGTVAQGEDGGRCTQAQLRRFIKSRPYVPMHELRRRFQLNGAPDEVSPFSTPDGVVWVGLPPREASFISELVRHGEIGLELCHDPCVRMVVGVFVMRPIAR